MNTDWLLHIRRSLRWVSLAALLLLAACNLPFGIRGISTLPPVGPAPTLTLEMTRPAPINLEPGAGTIMSWVDGSDFVYVPPGEFVMGTEKPVGGDNTPAHTVDLAGFWIQQTEVTNRMYAGCVAAGICAAPWRESGTPYWYADSSRADYPVVGVDWNEAQAYCKWIEGVLPTEAQWEKAARGTEARLYPWGEIDPACDLLNFKDCFNPSRINRVKAYPLGASPYLAADMAGNAFEWVNDWYAKDYYPQSPAADPPGPGTGQERVTRSSSFRSFVDALKVTLRWPENPGLHRADLGFRCVLTGEAAGNPPAPACETSAYVPIPTIPDTPVQPTPLAPLLTGTYCREAGGVQSGYAIIDVGEPYEPLNFEISSPDGDITCTAVPASNRMSCTGTALSPGTTATVTICPTISAVYFGEPGCPVGYAFDSLDGLCHFDLELATTGPEDCTSDEAWEEDYGCVPLAEEGVKPCTPGYFEVFTPDPSVPHECWPVGGPRRASDTCLVGTYLPEEGCCRIPDNLPPTCGPGYTYRPDVTSCYPDVYPDYCATLTITIPPCPTPPPPPTCYCCQFTNSLDCGLHITNGCKWSGVACVGP